MLPPSPLFLDDTRQLYYARLCTGTTSNGDSDRREFEYVHWRSQLAFEHNGSGSYWKFEYVLTGANRNSGNNVSSDMSGLTGSPRCLDSTFCILCQCWSSVRRTHARSPLFYIWLWKRWKGGAKHHRKILRDIGKFAANCCGSRWIGITKPAIHLACRGGVKHISGLLWSLL